MNRELDLLVLIAPARRRDEIVDALMAFEDISGFTLYDCAGFSREHSHFNLAEQVQGFGNYERFDILCSAAAREQLLPALADVAGRDHFRYWVLPLRDEGSIGDDSARL